MSPRSKLSLGERELDALYPFRIETDAKARIVTVGPSLARLAPELERGERFIDHVIVERPGFGGGNLLEWFEQADPGVLFVLRLREGGWLLRGQWVQGARGRFTFLGTPALRDEDDLERVGLRVSDFSPSDPIGTYLALAQVGKRSRDEQRGRLQRMLSRTKELERRLAHSEVERREQATFLQLVCHDTRARIGSLRERDADQELTSELAGFMGLADATLEFSRAERGEQPFECREYSPRELVREVLIRCRSLLPEEGPQLQGGVEASLPELVYGPFETQVRILVDLLLSAARTAHSNGMRLKLRRDTQLGPQFGFRAELTEDRGSVSEEMAARVVDPLGQVGEATGEPGAGVDLRLAIARRLVHLLGGRVEVNLAIHGFQRLIVHMPWANERAVRDGLDLPFPERALLVGPSDSSALRDLETQLDRLGAAVTWVSGPQQALEELREGGTERPFGVLFVPLRRAGEDWRQRLRRLLLTAPRPHPALMAAITTRSSDAASYQDSSVVELPLPDAELWKRICDARNRDSVPIGIACPLREGQQANALVVEDDRVTARIVASVLRNLGARVEVASDGHQAIDAWERMRHELLLVDLDLPTVDGAAAIRRIRAGESRPGATRILGLTHPDPAERGRTLRTAGADGLLSKPVRIPELYRVLDAWLRRAA